MFAVLLRSFGGKLEVSAPSNVSVQSDAHFCDKLSFIVL